MNTLLSLLSDKQVHGLLLSCGIVGGYFLKHFEVSISIRSKQRRAK